MAQRCHHYERAFEEFLRAQRIPYVAVDEARKALVPASVACTHPAPDSTIAGDRTDALKSFDFVIYTEPHNLLLDVKGRKVTARKPRTAVHAADDRPSLFPVRTEPPSSLAPLTGRLENWVTQGDIDSLTRWERLFGPDFRAAFVFVYWCESQPPDALFQEIYEHRGLWYALRAVRLDDYTRHMKPRSPKWGTVDLPTRTFESISHPISDWTGRPGGSGAFAPSPAHAATPARVPAYTL